MRAIYRTLSVASLGLATVAALALGSLAFSANTAEEAAAAAKAAVEKRTSPQTTWLGPTTGPTAAPGKRIVYISTGENNPICRLRWLPLWNSSPATACQSPPPKN